MDSPCVVKHINVLKNEPMCMIDIYDIKSVKPFSFN